MFLAGSYDPPSLLAAGGVFIIALIVCSIGFGALAYWICDEAKKDWQFQLKVWVMMMVIDVLMSVGIAMLFNHFNWVDFRRGIT